MTVAVGGEEDRPVTEAALASALAGVITVGE